MLKLVYWDVIRAPNQNIFADTGHALAASQGKDTSKCPFRGGKPNLTERAGWEKILHNSHGESELVYFSCFLFDWYQKQYISIKL